MTHYVSVLYVKVQSFLFWDTSCSLGNSSVQQESNSEVFWLMKMNQYILTHFTFFMNIFIALSIKS